MVSLISLQESYNFREQTLKSIAKMRITDSLKASCFVLTPSSNVAGIELEGNNWCIAHHSHSRDSSFKFKHWLSPSTKLTISQLVPNSKWFLVPNPSFKIVHKGIAGKHSIVEATWDTLSRSGCAGCTVYAGDDKEYKADISVYSKKGAVLKARAKLRRGLVHSVSATVGAIGPILSLKSRFGDADKVDTSYNMAARVVSVHAKHMGGDQGSAPRPQVLLNVALPLGTATLQPQVILGMKWHF